jgi:hypothetical protein
MSFANDFDSNSYECKHDDADFVTPKNKTRVLDVARKRSKGAVREIQGNILKKYMKMCEATDIQVNPDTQTYIDRVCRAKLRGKASYVEKSFRERMIDDYRRTLSLGDTAELFGERVTSKNEGVRIRVKRCLPVADHPCAPIYPGAVWGRKKEIPTTYCNMASSFIWVY